MIVGARRTLTLLALALTGYQAARGLWWTGPVAHPGLLLAALAAYLGVTWTCVFVGARPRSVVQRPRSLFPPPPAAPLPIWATLLATASQFVIPTLVTVAAGPAQRAAPYVTWYIGGLGALAALLMVLGRPFFAWASLVALGISSSIWLGFVEALSLGLVGSFVWVITAQLLIDSLKRAVRDAEKLDAIERATVAAAAVQEGRAAQRRAGITRALAIAGPVLLRTVESGGAISDTQRDAARRAEAELRDELRGPRLLDDRVRAAIAAARTRGTAVTVLDEGGLEGMGESDLREVRAEVAALLRSAASDRIYVRTSADPRIAVTVVGRTSVGQTPSDDDQVDLWSEIPRPTHADQE